MTLTTDDTITTYNAAVDAETTGVFLFAETDEPGDRRQFSKVGPDFFRAHPTAVVVYELADGSRRWARANQIVR